MTRAALSGCGVAVGLSVGTTVKVTAGVAVPFAGEFAIGVGTQLARIKLASIPAARRDEKRRIFIELVSISKWFSACVL
jgi:hypothetical protein